MMDAPFLKIAPRMSIISKANVRYEGIFVEIDTKTLQIALSDVRFYGTEDRSADVYIAIQEHIYPYVIFKSTDISEIRVMNNADEKPLIPVELQQVNGFTRHDYSQSTFPLGHFDASQSVTQSPRRASSLQRNFNSLHSFWARCNQSPSSRVGRHYSTYMWRIPRVYDFIGRSGDPHELPTYTDGDSFFFENEYDFEKNNQIFEDLLTGMENINLSNESDGKNKIENEDSENLPMQQHNNEEQKIEETVLKIGQGAIPKKQELISTTKSKPTATAYNKDKSFFDTVSCSSIYRSPNSNPNWREWNKETFGVPMIRHQRRKHRPVVSAIKTAEHDDKTSCKNFITDEVSHSDVKTVVTKTRCFNSSSGEARSSFDKNLKNENDVFENEEVKNYVLE